MYPTNDYQDWDTLKCASRSNYDPVDCIVVAELAFALLLLDFGLNKLSDLQLFYQLSLAVALTLGFELTQHYSASFPFVWQPSSRPALISMKEKCCM